MELVHVHGRPLLFGLALVVALAGRASADESVAPVDTQARVTELIAKLQRADEPDGTLHFMERMQAAAALGALGPDASRAAPALAAALDDRWRDVRIYTAQSLGQIGAKSDVVKKALAARLDDSELEVRAIAGRSLVDLGLTEGTKVVAALADVIEKDDPNGTTFALIALRELGPPAGDAAPSIRRHCEGKHYDSIACGALARIGPKGLAELAVLADAKHPTKVRLDARSSAAEVVVDALDGKRNDLDPLLAIVLGGLTDAEEKNRFTAVLELGAIGKSPKLDEAHRTKIADALEECAARKNQDLVVADFARSIAQELRTKR